MRGNVAERHPKVNDVADVCESNMGVAAVVQVGMMRTRMGTQASNHPDHRELPRQVALTRLTSRRRRAGRRTLAQWALTLIELLVVVTIIGILAALLMAALRNVRQSTYNARCVSNVRQLVQAATVYAQDCEDCLPGWPPPYDGSNDPNWNVQMAPYVGIKTNMTLYSSYGVPFDSLFFCPAKNSGIIPANFNGHYMYAMNFMLRLHGGGYHDTNPGGSVRLGDIQNHARTMAFTESGQNWCPSQAGDLDTGFFGAGANGDRAHGNTGMIPIAYLDGHAEFWGKPPTIAGDTNATLPWTHNAFWGQFHSEVAAGTGRGTWNP